MTTQEELRVREILEEEGILPIPKDLREMNRDELAKYFASKRSGRIVLSRLMRNCVWQAHHRIQTKVELPIHGNLRTFWYRFLKPILSKIPDDDLLKTDPYDLMLGTFTHLVVKRKLLRYADFDFTDENFENRRIGSKHPGILVFAEKTGWIRFLRQVNKTFGVSVLALGGAPSALTSEYTARDIKKALTRLAPNQEPTTRLIGIVDFDPSGDIIASSFANHLHQNGLFVVSHHTLIHPTQYTPDEIKLFRFPLPKGQETKTQTWLKNTGGIDGLPFGLEAESMPQDHLMRLLREVLAHLTQNNTEPGRPDDTTTTAENVPPTPRR